MAQPEPWKMKVTINKCHSQSFQSAVWISIFTVKYAYQPKNNVKKGILKILSGNNIALQLWHVCFRSTFILEEVAARGKFAG